MSATITARYEEDPGDAPIPARVELEVSLDSQTVVLVDVGAMDAALVLNPRQEQEAIERALHHYAREAGLPRAWVARIRVQRASFEHV